MSVIVAKAISANDHVEGGCVTGVTKQGTAFRYGGTVSDNGISLLNERWGDKFNYDTE
jgi:hypothetical protein